MITLNPRQQSIAQLAKEQGFVMIEALAAQLDVTTQTIRRDIGYLCEQGVLSRFHGGAAFRSSVANIPYEARRETLAREKEAIATAVAAEIENASSIFLDIGTTAEAVARKLHDKQGLRIVTNNLNVVPILSAKEDFEIIVACGNVRHRDLAITGDACAEFVERFKLDYSVLGVVAISPNGDILDFTLEESRLTQAIVRCGRRAFVVADHSKFGRPAMVKVAHLSQVDTLFTDQALPAAFADLPSIVRVSTAPETTAAGAR